jgi:FixJ family two-component response regulator
MTINQTEKLVMKQRENRDLVSVVDDDAAFRESTCWLVRSYGFKAESFDCAQEFLASPERDRTACLILDLCMPGMSGVELQQYLANEKTNIPIIFMTGYAHSDEERKAMISGAVAFLLKPLKDEALLGAIRTALDQNNLHEN